MEQFMFQLGAQVQQLTQTIQVHTQLIQDTRDLYEALAKQQGWVYSQDKKQWEPVR